MARISKLHAMLRLQTEAFHAEVADITAAKHGIPRTHFKHNEDICAALYENNAGLFEHHAALLAQGERAEAKALVERAVDRLAAADGWLFQTIDRGHYAFLLFAHHMNVPGSVADRVETAVAEAARTGDDERRQRGYRLRKSLLDRGIAFDPEGAIGDFTAGDSPSALRVAEEYHRKHGIGTIAG